MATKDKKEKAEKQDGLSSSRASFKYRRYICSKGQALIIVTVMSFLVFCSLAGMAVDQDIVGFG